MNPLLIFEFSAIGNKELYKICPWEDTFQHMRYYDMNKKVVQTWGDSSERFHFSMMLIILK